MMKQNVVHLPYLLATFATKIRGLAICKYFIYFPLDSSKLICIGNSIGDVASL
jgi:hypothetical protein